MPIEYLKDVELVTNNEVAKQLGIDISSNLKGGFE